MTVDEMSVDQIGGLQFYPEILKTFFIPTYLPYFDCFSVFQTNFHIFVIIK
jgi:hypothetical protein